MHYATPLNLKPLASTTENGSAVLNVAEYVEGQLALNCSERTGTNPTLDVVVEVSLDRGATWHTHTSFTQVTAAGKALKLLTNLGERLRVSWTLGGTDPDFTFSLDFVGKGASRL